MRVGRTAKKKLPSSFSEPEVKMGFPGVRILKLSQWLKKKTKPKKTSKGLLEGAETTKEKCHWIGSLNYFAS